MSSYRDVAQTLEALPALIRQTRRDRGLSVRGAAEQIGCAFSTISRIENGLPVNLSNAIALLRWVDES
ncbi:MAG: hypothetical protein NVS3B1_06030 [Marmoricola sp.]